MDETDQVLDSLSPYEVAMLVFTSPRSVESTAVGGGPIVITGKEAYVWAGAVAHGLIHRPELDKSDVISLLRRSVADAAPKWHQATDGRLLRRPSFEESGLVFVQAFLASAGFPDAVGEVYAFTEDALRSLEWKGLIQDPSRKKIGAFVVSVLLFLPVDFSAHGDEPVRIGTLTWEYSQRSTEDGRTDRDFRVKVREVSEAVLEDIVPTFVNVFEKLAGHEQMSDTDLQLRLTKLGFYKGDIDGKVGPKTSSALKQFQRDKGLRVTGYPDPETTRVLKASTGKP